MSYKDTGKRVYENHQLVSTESTQVFMSDAGEITIITKENSDGFSQKYTVRTKDGSYDITETISYVNGETGKEQTNIITIEGFVHKNSKNNSTTAYGTIMIGATKAGAIGAWQASSLPNDPSQFATIQQTPVNKPLVMTKIKHKGYNAINLNYGGETPTTGPNPFEGELVGKDWVENPNYNKWFATGIRIHSGWKDTWRGSQGCQTVKPGAGAYGKGTNWGGFSEAMKLSQYKEHEFIGYYYLTRL